jgi:predicted RNA methylase
MVVGVDEQLQVRPELFVGLVVIALDRGVLDGAVHPLDLTVGPGMVGLGQTMLDAVLVADAVEHVPAVESCRT